MLEPGVESQRLRVMVVDDEPPAIERLGALLSEFAPDVEVLGYESRPERVSPRCRELRPDVVLLDVEMPGLDGRELAAQLARLDPAPGIIFVTAHEHYAVDAFGLAAIDYLVKPVRRERLRQALSRARTARGGVRGWIAGQIGERRVRIPLDRVRAFVAEGKCTLVHAVDCLAVVAEPLKTIEQRHGSEFLRIHRKALVSRRHLRELYTDPVGVERVRIEGVRIEPEVSRRNRAAVREALAD